MIGIPADELRGVPIGVVTHPADRDGDRVTFERLFSGESEGYRREKRYVRPDGSVLLGGA